ncbi:MAG TPA: dTDP-4-dehydrorhamnose 3,5-epimerase family protein [Patescibacteria group bacterium]
MEKTTEFKIKQTEIPGLLEIDISLIEDARGWFQEKFQKAKLVAAGFPESFNPVQQNIGYNKTVGVTRGIHAEPWDKYISTISGKVHAVFVDLRSGDNFGKKVSIVMDPKKAVFVPQYVGNSYQVLEPDTYYSYLVNAHWIPEGKYLSVNLADPDLAIQWPISLDKAIISEKDRNAPMLKDKYQ